MTNERVLVVAAHPDDEILGLGGTLARHVSAGDDVRALIVAEGITSREQQRDAMVQADALADLRSAALSAAAVLGCQPPQFLGLPDNRLDSIDLLDIVKPIQVIIDEQRPTVVYTHHGGDLNIDHRLVYQAVLTACRPMPGDFVRAIYAFETVSSTEYGVARGNDMFCPTHFVNVTDWLDVKRRALECYRSEMRPFPHARSLENVEHLARYRGASVGIEAAEAFMVVRDVLR